MYGFSNSMSNNELFEKISQEAVFRHVFGDFKINNYLCSPFRKDDNPGCWIKWSGNKLMFCDYANSSFLDMIGIIQEKHNLGYHEAIDFIADNKFEGEPEYIKRSKQRAKSSFTLEFCPKPFDKYAKSYWQQYDITSSQLIDDNIFSTAWFKFKNSTGSWTTISPHAAEASYTISMEQSLKICRPYVKNKRHKWITNATQNKIGGAEKLPFVGEDLIITKSYKDWRVLTNLGLTAIWLQNEGQIPDSNILNPIVNMFDNVIVWFDNDNAGIQASKKLVSIINNTYIGKANNITLPTKEKDPADVIKAGKKEFLINFVNTNFKTIETYGN